MTKRTRRYLGALIAAGVTTFLAMNLVSGAHAQGCGLKDATSWQLALHDEDVEQSPDYIRAVTESFLSACPVRPEYADASRIAGIAAADMNDVEAASEHFRNAGPMQGVSANFYAMMVFHLAGDPVLAWRSRDNLVGAWHRRLSRHDKVSISAESVPGGTIYQVYYSETDRESGVRAAWVAVPSGPGLPATLTFSNERMRMAFHRIRAAEDDDFRYVDLHRCHGRRTLGRIETSVSVTEFDAAARASLTAYLANPDLPVLSARNEVQMCAFPARLFPGVPKR
ncbi:MAG: hypothetical protein AAFV59_14160 [Pseudomonadota bacterium]